MCRAGQTGEVAASDPLVIMLASHFETFAGPTVTAGLEYVALPVGVTSLERAKFYY